MHFIPNLLQNFWIIKLYWEPEFNRTQHFCFFLDYFLKRLRLTIRHIFGGTNWLQHLWQDGTNGIFFIKLFFPGLRFSVEEALSSPILILSRSNNVWCLRPYVLQIQYVHNTNSVFTQYPDCKQLKHSFVCCMILVFSSIFEFLNLLHCDKKWLFE